MAPKSGVTVQSACGNGSRGSRCRETSRSAGRRGAAVGPLGEALAVLEGAAEGLAYAHAPAAAAPRAAAREHLPRARGSSRGETPVSSTVLDFGIGRAVDVAEVAVRGAQGLPALSSGYLAPEQVRRGRGELGPRAEHPYSLALILLEVLTDRPLSAPGTMDEAIERALDPVSAVAWVDRRLPAPVARVLERALSVHPPRRFAHVSGRSCVVGCRRARGAVRAPPQAAGVGGAPSPRSALAAAR